MNDPVVRGRRSKRSGILGPQAPMRTADNHRLADEESDKPSEEPVVVVDVS
jgi:hypothetical protein